MAISNELSSEIAAALLAHSHSPQELKQLRDVLLEIHSTLQKMSEEAHQSRLRMVSQNMPTDNSH